MITKILIILRRYVTHMIIRNPQSNLWFRGTFDYYMLLREAEKPKWFVKLFISKKGRALLLYKILLKCNKWLQTLQYSLVQSRYRYLEKCTAKRNRLRGRNPSLYARLTREIKLTQENIDSSYLMRQIHTSDLKNEGIGSVGFHQSICMPSPEQLK